MRTKGIFYIQGRQLAPADIHRIIALLKLGLSPAPAPTHSAAPREKTDPLLRGVDLFIDALEDTP